MNLVRSFPRHFRGVPYVLAVAGLLVVACAPAAAPSPTAAPKAETKAAPAAPAPAASPAAAPAAKPAESPAAAAPAKPAASPVAAPAAAPAASPAAAAAAKPAASPAAAAKPIALPPPEKKSLKFAHSILEATQLAYVVAAEAGLYKKYGFDDVELLYTEGDAKTLSALVSGAVDLTAHGISVTISSQITDVPLTTIAMTATILTDAVVTAPDVKTKEDLRGKAFAISTFGSTAHAAALIGLEALGMTGNDVNIVQVGGQAARIAALRGGSVAATIVDVALEDEMKAQGFNVLTRLPDSPQEFGRNGMQVRREWVTQNPNTVLALTAATLEGQNMIWTNTPFAVDVFMKWAQITDRARAESEVEFFKRYGNRDMRWNKDGWERARDVLAISNPDVKDVDVEKAYTYQFLDRLRELGLYDQLGVPARAR